MQDFTILTPTEILSLINKTNDKYESIKKEIISHLDIIKEHETIINEHGDIINNKLLIELKNLEDNYVLLVEELNKRI